MRRAQGNTRSRPDGFLHIQNFTVTKAAGIAGAVYAYVLNAHQRRVIEDILIERAFVIEEAAGRLRLPYTSVHFKHGQWRFCKVFLKDNFRSAVHETTKLMETPVINIFKDKLIAERESLK